MAPASQPVMTQKFVDDHTDIVEKQARQQFKQSNLFSVEDISQAIWLHMAENFKFVDGKSREEISKYAYRAAATFCKTQRDDFMYFSGGVLYSGDMVERILADSVFNDLGPGIDVEGRVDIQRAFERLTPSRQAAVYARFALKKGTGDLDAKSLERGVHDITNYLNSRIQMERAEMEEAAERV